MHWSLFFIFIDVHLSSAKIGERGGALLECGAYASDFNFRLLCSVGSFRCMYPYVELTALLGLPLVTRALVLASGADLTP